MNRLVKVLGFSIIYTLCVRDLLQVRLFRHSTPTVHQYTYSVFTDAVANEGSLNMRFPETQPCKPLPSTGDNTWIIAENAMNGISNQLFGVYSFIPMAMTWNVSLVVAGIYTRRSFEVKPHKYVGWDLQPFEAYFDWNYFATYWFKQKGIVAVRLQDYQTCLDERVWQSQGRIKEIVRDPPFYAQKEAVLMEMLTKSNISFPITRNTILRMDAKHSKLTAMFNYWKGGMASKMLLLQVHRSLRPSVAIQHRVDQMLHNGDLVHSLSSRGIKGDTRNYVAMHIRLEGDMLLHLRRDFSTSWSVALHWIQQSQCFATLSKDAKGRFIDAPILYLASGLFNTTLAADINNLVYNSANGSSMKVSNGQLSHTERAALVLQDLHNLGFKDIETRLTLEPSIQQQQSTEQTASFSPEQEAWVDLLISRGSECFVSAHLPSSFSYMVQRMQMLDRGQVLKYVYVTEERFGKSHEFKQWGV